MPDMQIAGNTEQQTPPQDTISAHASQIQDIVDETYEKFKDVDDGNVATYIPELGKANPKDFGICLTTVEGHVFKAGDWDKEFTIQSMCKPFAFQMALEQHGLATVLKHVGVEPSGDAFNSIELDPRTTRPFNPMINAGAIQLGVSVYSPRLDAQGNSVRGILACKEIASHFGLHAFEFTNVGSSFMQWLL